METYGKYGYTMFIMVTRNVVKYVCFSAVHIKQILNHGGYVNQQVSVWAINKDVEK